MIIINRTSCVLVQNSFIEKYNSFIKNCVKVKLFLWDPRLKKKAQSPISITDKHLDNPQDFWEDILWPGKENKPRFWSKMNVFLCQKHRNKTYQLHGGGRVVAWGSIRPGWLGRPGGAVSFTLYHNMLKKNVRHHLLILAPANWGYTSEQRSKKHQQVETASKKPKWIFQSDLVTILDLHQIGKLLHDSNVFVWN